MLRRIVSLLIIIVALLAMGPTVVKAQAALPDAPKPKPHKLVRFIGHLAIGAGTEAGISAIAGGPRKWPAGLTAATVVAAFKEGSDAVAGRDTRKQATVHALMIVAGAGIVALAWHGQANQPVPVHIEYPYMGR